MTQFGPRLKTFRAARHLSQSALAGETNISARHLSFLETGRARPSRMTVDLLARALALPRPDHNRLLQDAGFAPAFRSHDLAADDLAPVTAAMSLMLRNHQPFPAIIQDADWRIFDLNAPAAAMLSPFGLGRGDSVFALLNSETGPQVFANWPELGALVAERLRAELARKPGNAALTRAARDLAADPAIAGHSLPATRPAFIPAIADIAGQRLSLLSAIAQFSSVDDLLVADLQIELYFPADAATRSFFETLPGQTPGA